MKNKAGTAGIPRASGEGNSPTGNAVNGPVSFPFLRLLSHTPRAFPSSHFYFFDGILLFYLPFCCLRKCKRPGGNLCIPPLPTNHPHIDQICHIASILMLTHISQDDNDDYCSSCGGNGELVCCDGCTRSYHYVCVDPPFDRSLPLPDRWHCNVCENAGNSRLPHESSGIFGALLVNITRKNPDAFSLPRDIREHFDNVKTGASGEYEEEITVTHKPK